MEYTNKSDIKFNIAMTDVDGVPVPLLEFDWGLDFFTRKDGNKMSVTCKGGVLSDNAKIKEGVLVVALDAPDWGFLGDLYMQFSSRFTDSDFKDGSEDNKTVATKLPIKIVEL